MSSAEEVRHAEAPHHWHALPATDALSHHGVEPDHGLSDAEAALRLARHGPNRPSQPAGPGPLQRFLAQLKEPLVLVLIGAGIVTGLLGEWVDCAVIFGVVVVNAVIGYLQEGKAEAALAALARAVATEVTVVRGGTRRRMDAVHLVPGDVVLLAESFSTPLATLIAASEGSRVKALVLVAGFCSSPQPSGLGWLPLQPLFSLTPPAFLLKQFLVDENSPPELLDSLAKSIRDIPGATLAERARVVLALRESDCPDLRGVPMLLLQARQDRVIPWDAQSQLERHFPDATCHWINGPHLLLQTRTQECRDAVIGFLTGVP